MRSFVIIARRLAAVGCLLAAPLVAHAVPSVGSCAAGDAPATHSSESCNSVCTVSGSELTCDMEVLCPTAVFNGANAKVVAEFGASVHDISAWGECSGTNTEFCCVFDDGGDTVNIVSLMGTDDHDEVLRLSHDIGLGTEENLQPWDTYSVTGYVRGQIGDDQIAGSNYAGTDYADKLYGQNGDDIIDANGGADFLSGGNGDDDMRGNAGDDTNWGGDGDDISSGMGGADALCDSAGYDVCASNGGNLFNGGDGDDRIWFQQPEDPLLPCPGVLPDGASTAGNGLNDQCGDFNDFTIAELPDFCENQITVVPNRCVGAN